MAKRWLGSAALGLSLALLLVTGCADKDCVPCYPGTAQALVPDKYLVNLSARLADGQVYCAMLFQDGKPVSEVPECGVPGEALAAATFYVTCDDPTFFVSTDLPRVGPFSGKVKDPFGEWQLGAWVQEEAIAEAWDWDNFEDWVDWLMGWLVADECPTEEVAEEFVPEPGTIALLGSGLAGLAGYATLRWRNRK